MSASHFHVGSEGNPTYMWQEGNGRRMFKGVAPGMIKYGLARSWRLFDGEQVNAPVYVLSGGRHCDVTRTHSVTDSSLWAISSDTDFWLVCVDFWFVSPSVRKGQPSPKIKSRIIYI